VIDRGVWLDLKLEIGMKNINNNQEANCDVRRSDGI
jgi:hypothetical protein